MEINFIITCFDKEEYYHGALQVLKSYKTIIPKIAFVYNGSSLHFPADIKINNKGHQLGDIELTLAGYNYLKNTSQTNRYVKLCIDSWLLNENIIIEIFNGMHKNQSCYAGNYWFENSKNSLSTDIFFVDLNHGNIFEKFEWDGDHFETSMFKTLQKMNGIVSIISSREPVHPHNRFACDSLQWTMSHEIKENLNQLWKSNLIN